jgi:hypothetical protein
MGKASLISNAALLFIPKPYKLLAGVWSLYLGSARTGIDTDLILYDPSESPLEQASRALGYASDLTGVIAAAAVVVAPEISIPALVVAQGALKLAQFGVKCYDHYHNEVAAQ